MDFLPGLLGYEWETTPDDSKGRRKFLQGIELAQAWLQGMEGPLCRLLCPSDLKSISDARFTDHPVAR